MLRRLPGHPPAEAEPEQPDPIRREAGFRLQERGPALQIGHALRRGAGGRLDRGPVGRRDGRRAAGARQRVREQGGVPVLGEPARHAAQELGRAVLAGADDDPGARRSRRRARQVPLDGRAGSPDASTIGRPSPCPVPARSVVLPRPRAQRSPRLPPPASLAAPARSREPPTPFRLPLDGRAPRRRSGGATGSAPRRIDRLADGELAEVGRSADGLGGWCSTAGTPPRGGRAAGAGTPAARPGAPTRSGRAFWPEGAVGELPGPPHRAAVDGWPSPAAPPRRGPRSGRRLSGAVAVTRLR